MTVNPEYISLPAAWSSRLLLRMRSRDCFSGFVRFYL